LSGPDAAGFIPHVFAPLCEGDGSSIPPSIATQLIESGIAQDAGAATSAIAARAQARVSILRDTELIRNVATHLRALDIDLADDADEAVAVGDLRGLELSQIFDIVREAHTRAAAALWIWEHEGSVVVGPLSAPHRTACWNCARIRLSQPPTNEHAASSGHESDLAIAVAQMLFIASRFPHAAAWGCVALEEQRGTTLHAVVPLPSCEICGGAASIQTPAWTNVTDASDLPEEWRLLADRSAGLIRRIYFEPDAHAMEPPYTAAAVLAEDVHGEGKGASRSDAVRSAVGEAIERYAAGWRDDVELLLSTQRELGSCAFDPHRLVLYDHEQYALPDFQFARYDEGLPIHWTLGRWLDTNESVYVPALTAFMNFPAPPQAYFCQVTSNGLACGATFFDAALRALYEAIERDAFMLAWLSGASPVRLDHDGSLPQLVQRALQQMSRFGAETELYLLDSAGEVPTVACLGIGDGNAWPGVTMGLATDADFDTALQRAVFEHSHCGSYMRRLMESGEHRHLHKAEDVCSHVDHALYYLDPKRITAFERFRRSSTVVPLSRARESSLREATLETVVQRLHGDGIRVAAADLTSPDVALAGLHVVRAFGTDLQPVHFGYGNRRLRNPRLQKLLNGRAATLEPHPLA
jgi:ribosomal protein S12 methylthiotransferase accessory factor